MTSLPKNGNRAPIAGGGKGIYNLHRVCHTTVTATSIAAIAQSVSALGVRSSLWAKKVSLKNLNVTIRAIN